MQPRASWLFGIVVALLFFFIFFMPTIGVRFRELLGPQIVAPSDAEQLAVENASLKARLAELSVITDELPNSTPDTVRAMVYSDYPFNFKNELTVDAGSLDGIAKNDAVLFEGNLVGVITGVSAHSSVVQTIFDPNFKLPVRIGDKGYDALLVGGSYPMVESIAKSADVAKGNIVYSAASGMPYAMPVGEVASVSLTPNDLFEEASLSSPYDISAMQTVFIVK